MSVRALDQHPSTEEAPASAKADRQFLFESLLNDRFAIFLSRESDRRAEPLIASSRHCIFGSPSPCGRFIAFAEADSLDRLAASSVKLFDRNDRSILTIAEDGTFPAFSRDGRSLYYERGRREIVALRRDTGKEEVLFTPEEFSFGNYQVSKANVSADESTLYVTSDRGGRWTVWRISLRTRETVKVGSGCEPVSLRNGDAVIWISAKGKFSGTEVLMKDFTTGTTTKLLPNIRARYQYFPSVNFDEKWLLCSVSRPFDLFRHGAKYSLLGLEIATGKTVDLKRTESAARWGRWIP